jgi:hypothetical protein
LSIQPWGDLRASVECALRTFLAEDAYLLQRSASERALCHRFAVHLAAEFSEFDVDCEYNLDGYGHKKVYRPTRRRRCPVYPDIVVHKRGPGPNLIAIEVKKGINRRVGRFDKEKLAGYRAYYGYAETLFLELPVGRHFGKAPFLVWHP